MGNLRLQAACSEIQHGSGCWKLLPGSLEWVLDSKDDMQDKSLRPGAVAIPNAWDQRLARVPAGAEGDGHHRGLPQPRQEGALRLLALPILTVLHTHRCKRPLSDVDNWKS